MLLLKMIGIFGTIRFLFALIQKFVQTFKLVFTFFPTFHIFKIPPIFLLVFSSMSYTIYAILLTSSSTPRLGLPPSFMFFFFLTYFTFRSIANNSEIHIYIMQWLNCCYFFLFSFWVYFASFKWFLHLLGLKCLALKSLFFQEHFIRS